MSGRRTMPTRRLLLCTFNKPRCRTALSCPGSCAEDGGGLPGAFLLTTGGPHSDLGATCQVDISGQVLELNWDVGVYSGAGKGWLSALVPWGQLPRQVAHLGLCFWTSVPAASPRVRQGRRLGRHWWARVGYEASTACRTSTLEGAGLVRTPRQAQAWAEACGKEMAGVGTRLPPPLPR